MPENISWVKAQDLLTFRHIDLFIKMKYVEFKTKGYDMHWISEVYAKTIEAFSEGSYTEEGQEDKKKSLDDYIKIFNELIDNISKNGFDSNYPIPVDFSGLIKNGAHRTAIAAYLKIDVAIKKETGKALLADTAFFTTRLLEEKYINYMVQEYCHNKKDIHVACIWPSIGCNREWIAIDELKASFEVVYIKKIPITLKGLRNIIIQLYDDFEWLGSANEHFPGSWGKAEPCWNPENPKICIVIFEAKSVNDVQYVKERIRDKVGMGNHALHITDTQEEAAEAADIFLNKNSLDLICYGFPDKYNGMYERINDFKKRVKKRGYSLDNFIFDSSAVMALYGLRPAGDMDFLSIEQILEEVETKEDFRNHIELVNFHDKLLEELLYNPDNYLTCWGVKFITLERLLHFKKNRGESKDYHDIRLIAPVLEHRNTWKDQVVRMSCAFKRFVRNKLYLLKRIIIILLKKFKLYESAKKIWKRMQRVG